MLLKGCILAGKDKRVDVVEDGLFRELAVLFVLGLDEDVQEILFSVGIGVALLALQQTVSDDRLARLGAVVDTLDTALARLGEIVPQERRNLGVVVDVVKD